MQALWSRRSEVGKFRQALAGLLTRRQRKELDRAGLPKARLSAAVAQLLGITERAVLEQVGNTLKVPVVHRVPSFTLENVPEELRGALQEAHVAPLIRDGKLVGLISSNLDLISPRLKHLALPVALATFEQIEDAWSHLGSTERGRGCTVDDVESIVRRLWGEVRQYAGTEVQVFPEGPELVYRFRARLRAEWGIKGREATGRIRAPSVLNWLRSAQSEPMKLNVLGDEFSLEVREDPETRGIILARRSEAPGEAKTTNDLAPVGQDSPCRGREVLLLEDNASIASVLKRMVTRTGASCKWYPDGSVALEALMAGHIVPDMMLCDIHMPEMDGITFVRKVRMLSNFQETPIVMLTSDEAIEAELRSLKSGADAFVGKSEDPKILMGYVERMLARTAQRSAA
jgi:CheY-like chemotaxis protein